MTISFICNIKNDPSFNPDTLYYYNGEINVIQGIHNEEELKYIRQAYEETTGLALQSYTWDGKVGAYHNRIFGVLKPDSREKTFNEWLIKLEAYQKTYLDKYANPTSFTASMQLAIRETPNKTSLVVHTCKVGDKFDILDAVTVCDFNWGKVELDIEGKKVTGWIPMSDIIGNEFGEMGFN